MTREALLAIVVLTAPWALVLCVALARGYDLTVTLTRHRDTQR